MVGVRLNDNTRVNRRRGIYRYYVNAPELRMGGSLSGLSRYCLSGDKKREDRLHSD